MDDATGMADPVFNGTLRVAWILAHFQPCKNVRPPFPVPRLSWVDLELGAAAYPSPGCGGMTALGRLADTATRQMLKPAFAKHPDFTQIILPAHDYWNDRVHYTLPSSRLLRPGVSSVDRAGSTTAAW